jgi:predicted CopG family antitoxin
MQRKLTITVDEEVYKGLHNKIGRDRISSFLNRLARPYVVSEEIEASFRRMASDEERESAAEDWIEGIVGDIADEKS